MKSKRTNRRLFRFSLRKLLIVVAVVALSFVAVPTAIHLWTWPEDKQLFSKDILKRVEQADWMNRQRIVRSIDPETGVITFRSSGTGAFFYDHDTVSISVHGLKNAAGDYVEPEEGFELKVNHRNQSEPKTYKCLTADDAMRILRYEHWKYHLNWGSRLADRLQRWWQGDEESDQNRGNIAIFDPQNYPPPYICEYPVEE